MEEPKFSIIICAYNVGNYIDASIISVLEQDYDNYELVIYNDGSTDNTAEVIKKYKDKKINFIDCKQNKGLGAARNIAVKKARGEYILYLDADDSLYANDTLSRIYEVLGREKIDIAYFGVQYIGGDNRLYIPTAENSTKEARIACDMHFAVSSKCWRREFLIKNNITFVENMYYEDMVYSLKSIIHADKITYGAFPIYNYVRNREGSIMSTPNIRRCSDMYRMMSYVMDLYEETPEKYKPYLLSFIKNETNGLYPRTVCVLKALKEHTGTPIFPKRNYVFEEEKELK